MSDVCRAAGASIAVTEVLPIENDNNFEETVVSAGVHDARLLLNAFIVDFDVITVLIKAMQLSGWVFHMKVGMSCVNIPFHIYLSTVVVQGKVYRALARLAGHPLFYDKLKKENGIPVIVYEHRIRRHAQKQNNLVSSIASSSSKNSAGLEPIDHVFDDDDNDDEFTDELVVRLKRDYACIKIQACCRTFMTKQRHVRLMELLGKLKKN